MSEESTRSSEHPDTVGVFCSARALRTRADIHRAALLLAQSRPVSEITVDEIAQAAEVSRRTFFNHFPTKNHAFVPDIAAVPPDALERFRSGRTPDMLTAIGELLRSRAAALWPSIGEPASVMYVKQSNPELQPLLLEAGRALELRLREASAERLGVAADSPVAIATAGLIGMVERSSFDLWVHQYGRGSIPTPAQVSALIDQTIDGVREALRI